MMKLPDGLTAWIAIILTSAGGTAATAMHWGVESNKIDTLSSQVAADRARGDATAAEVAKQETNLAVLDQKLTDILSGVRRIEKKL